MFPGVFCKKRPEREMRPPAFAEGRQGGSALRTGWIFGSTPVKGRKERKIEVETARVSRLAGMTYWLVGRLPLNTLTKVNFSICNGYA
jgi:hypothetical protein